MRRSMAYFALIVIVFSCSNPSESSDESNNIFPLTAGNTWTYEQTTTTDSTSETITYSMRVIGSEVIGGKEWQKIDFFSNNSNFTRSSWHLMAIDDKIYELQWNFQNPVSALQYFIPQDSVAEFVTLLGGDVSITKKAKRINTPVTTPAGTFTNCYEFSYASPEWYFVEILAAGIGIVKKERVFFDFSTGEKYLHYIDVLTDYQFPKDDTD